MKKVVAVKNQYLGINAHLHSFWQKMGGWKEFHTSHIVDLTRILKNDLLPLGYTAGIEDSLQIRREGSDDGYPESDIAIHDRDPIRPFLHYEGGVALAEKGQVLTIPELLEDEAELSEYRAISVRSRRNERDESTLVAWIELLSPSNKLQDVELYKAKRTELLRAGIVYVELDYLHESPPTVRRIANYAGWRRRGWSQTNSHAYRVLIIDPRPELYEGKAIHYEFDVDQPIPTVQIPLNGSDVLTFDFGPAYHKTLAETFFAYEFVDYSQYPVNFERYSPEDRQRIAMRMVAVLEAARDGINLESGPFERPEISFEEAVQRVEKCRLSLQTNR